MYNFFLKYIIDIFIAFLGLVILSPVILLTAVVLYFLNGSNPFFIQERPGKDEKIFKLYKFKTMSDKKDENGNLLPDKERLTPLGKFIRSISIDELPQLWNVLKGDMSLIGPRPLLVKYLSLYNEHQRRRHEVRPGLTGWAQVNGRNELSWEDRLDLDVYYVDNRSFKLDLSIFFLTIKIVILRKGISGKGAVTMSSFKGNFKK